VHDSPSLSFPPPLPSSPAAEPDVDDAVYIGMCVFLFNAAAANTNVLSLMPPFAPRHHRYLRGRNPALVPQVNFLAAAAFAGDLFHPQAAAPPVVVRANKERISSDGAGPAEVAMEVVEDSTRDDSGDDGVGDDHGVGIDDTAGGSPDSRSGDVGGAGLASAIAAVAGAVAALGRGEHVRAMAELQLCRRQLASLGRYTAPARRGEILVHYGYASWLLEHCRVAAALARASAVDATRPAAAELLYHLGARHSGVPHEALGALALCRALSHGLDVCRMVMLPGDNWDDTRAAVEGFVARVHSLTDKVAVGGRGSGSTSECAAALRRCAAELESALGGGGGASGGGAAPRERQSVAAALRPLISCAPPLLGDVSGVSPPATATMFEPTRRQAAVSLTAGLPQALPVVARLASVTDVAAVRVRTTYPDGRRVTVAPPPHHLRPVGGGGSVGAGGGKHERTLSVPFEHCVCVCVARARARVCVCVCEEGGG
jgi:hypothetical protein